jgi:phytoene desaturase
VARVVVVGAGMGGLAVAARLARLGHSVVVCEQAATHGGKAGSYTRDGFRFDTGPTLLTLPAAYRDLFLKTGKRQPLEDAVDLVPVDPAFHYRFADGTRLCLPNASRPGVRKEMAAALGDEAAADWDRLLTYAGELWSVVRQPFVESPLPGGWRSLLPLARRVTDVRTVAPWRTLRGLGRRQLGDPRLRMLLERYATYVGSDPRRAPSALGVIPYVEQTFGVWYVRGGIRRLADAVYERCLMRGVTFRFGADVAEVVTAGARVSGVRLASGEPVSADVVVSDADALHLYRDLVRAPRPSPSRGDHAVLRSYPQLRRERGRVSRAPRSLSGFVLLLALRGRTPGLGHHTVLFPRDYDAELDAVFGRRARPVEDPTVYIAAPDDPAVRPDAQHEAWFVLVNAATQGRVDWTAPGLAEGYADHLLAVLARRGLDVRDRVLWRETRTPADLERDTRSPGGSIYGSASHGARASFLRPANRSPVPGLYLVGGSTHPGGGLPLVALSAALVAEMIGRA